MDEKHDWSALVTDDVLASLRHKQDDVGSEAVEKLYEIANEDTTAPCPVPRGDLFAVLEQHHWAHPALQKLWDQTNSVPEWVNWDQIKRGQHFFYRYAVANMLGFALQGFIGENVAAFGPAEVLVRTGGLSKKTLMKRVFETFQWVVEATESLESIQPGGKGHASTVRVRILHASVRRRITRLAAERPKYFDMSQLGAPINLYDSILTVTFFCCNPVWVQLPQLGIKPSDAEIEDFVALYRYLSYLLGSPAEYFDSADHAKATMRVMLARKQAPTESSQKIAHAFIDCLADSPPLFLSKDLIYAGCRHFNTPELCDHLGIREPRIYPYAMFKAICFITYVIAQAQKVNSRIDDYMIKTFRHVLPKVIEAGLGGTSNFGFQYLPTLSSERPSGKNGHKIQAAGVPIWKRRFEVGVSLAIAVVVCSLLSFGWIGFCAARWIVSCLSI